MPVSRSEPHSVQGEVDRQAVASLGGYLHQILASAIAWLHLSPDALLHLEVAEDYAVTLRERLDATQVKRSAGTVSLAAEPVRSAIQSFVQLVGLNPGKHVRLTLLTTAEIVAERQVAHRLGGIAGLHWWRDAANGAEIGGLRDVLLTLDLGSDVRQFILDRNDDELRRDLVQRIDWRCGSADTEELRTALGRLVADLCFAEFDLGPAEGEQRVDNVIQAVMAACVRASGRVLTHSDLRATLRRATDITIDRKTFNALVGESLAASSYPRDGSERLYDLDRVGKLVRPRDLLDKTRDVSVAPERLGPSETQRLRRVLGSKSATLLNWPTTTAGRWLDRPELDDMLERLLVPSPPLVLLGAPGSGKSALMARLGAALTSSGAILLAIKADMIPRDITSVPALGREFGVPGPLDECLVRLALEGPVVLLIDQIDALADLMDQHGGRLGALLSLVALVRGQPNLRIILSSREFEFRHDARLTALDADPIRLGLPTWEAVQPVLEAEGLQPSEMHAEFREVLRTPQHLDLFLSHIADNGEGAAYDSYHDMLDTVFRTRILQGAGGAGDGATLHSVARAMVEEEELWVPSARFDAHVGAIQRLEASGFLIRDGRRIGFRHQTLFDFVRARAFIADGESVADYALGRQGTIFARPTIWSAFSYLRASDPVLYHRQMRRLWTSASLRLHLRWLLRDFVGQQAQPTDEEARLLLPALADGKPDRVLHSMSGSPGWFERLLPRLPDLMKAADPLGWSCAAFLRSVAATKGEAVLELVEAHWTGGSHQGRVHYVLEGLTEWTDRAADIADGLAGSLDKWATVRLAEAAARCMPHRVPGLVLRKLEGVLADARTQPSTRQALTNFCRDPSGFYGLSKLLGQTPALSVRILWPWFAAVAAETATAYQTQGRYRQDQGALLERYGLNAPHEHRPGPAIGAVIVSWAEAEPDAFLCFAGMQASSDLEVLHCLLAKGFLALAAQRPAAVLRYLLADERRLRLSEALGDDKVSKDLIAALSSSLPKDELPKLVSGIMKVTGGRDLSAYPPIDRLKALRWIRQERLGLLLAVPEQCRTSDVARYIEEELRAVGEPEQGGGITFITSGNVQITAAGLAKAKDRDILRFLGLHPDASEWGSVFERRRNRSVDASRVFGEFAKEHPERAMRLAGRLPPGKLERPVSQAISAISEKAAVPPAEIVKFVVDLHHRGFASVEFRHDAAYALIRAGDALGGLDGDVCEMLAGWLQAQTQSPEAASDEDKVLEEDKELRPLLWGTGGIRLLPGGNFPVMRALEVGLIRRDPPGADAWLAMLEEHLGKRENPKVWQALADDLRFLWHADHGRTVTFFERLFKTQPSLTQSVEGLRLMAWTHRWLPNDLVHRQLRGWINGTWVQGKQAAGELAGLRAVLVPEDAETISLLETNLSNPVEGGETSDFLFGVACTMAELWTDAAHREQATSWIEKLTGVCDRKLSGALRPLFSAALGVTWDAATERVLRACLLRPVLLGADPHHLPKLLKEVLRDGLEPLLVGKLSLGLVRSEQAGTEQPGTRWVGSIPDLFELATALQRIEETREIGTELFEEMLGAEFYSIASQLGNFDRNRFA